MGLIAIDPGAGGAFALCKDGVVSARNMPHDVTGICDLLRELRSEGYDKAIVEKVGGYRPGNSGPAAVTFARHCGTLDAAVYSAGIALVANPIPNKWMAMVPVPKFTGVTDAKSKTLRKQWLKDWSQRRFPDVKVTLTNGDALAMLAMYMPQYT